jgi:Zn-dependent protease
MPTDLVGRLIIYIVVLLLAVSVHEAAHAWMSYKFGDDTAYLLGRVTLNPVRHTDPIGTLLIPIVSFIGSSAGVFVPLIGWGKPTPVNPLRWRNKNVANVMVSLAGIMANMLVAAIALIILKVLLVAGVFDGGSLGSFGEPVKLLLLEALLLNASLAVFNLIPIPPLDGSKVLYSILPASAQPALEGLERFSFIILIAAIYFGVFNALFAPVAAFIVFLLRL